MRNSICLATLLVAIACGSALAAEPQRTGSQIFTEQCAVCHGEKGEGTQDEYPHALAGDKSVAELAALIAKTMPKDAEGECVGEDAQRVAAYIHESFYSPLAQARNKPPRIELSRLTVRQYRSVVADLVGSFRTAGHWDERHALRGEYYNARNFRNDKRVLDRLDPEVKFDFGAAGPEPDKFDANLFSIRWQGAVLTGETGEYEFVVRTDHAVRLWVNDERQPLIDAWVKSGTDNEFRGSLWLLGGRAYPLRLEFSKAKQGVDDSKTNKAKPKEVNAGIELAWKPPQRAEEVIPARRLSPQRFPETFVVTTPFPPDDRSVGWERATSISKAWDQATTDAAIETAGYVVANLRELAGVRRDAAKDDPQLREFCRQFAERAFRRPLTQEQQEIYIERQFQEARDAESAVRRVVLLALKSPRFLYREAGGAAGDFHVVASRLALGLWDSLPDQELQRAAAAGELATREQVARQAERMLADLRARTKLREFLLRWLKVEEHPDLSKDDKQFPEFTEVVSSDLRTSLELFLDDVQTSETADFRQLLLANYMYLNGRLAKFYGADLPPDAPFQKVSLEPGARSGVLSHPYLLADFAYTSTSSPIHRGVFISRNLLGRSLRPPPEAVSPLAPDLHPDLTTRQRVVLQTKNDACLRCHGMINPLGFTLEHFDAVGRYRTQEKGKAIDASGAYQARSGDVLKFGGLPEMAKFLAGSEETHAAFVEQLFHDLVKQPIGAYGLQTLPNLREGFIKQDFNIRKLMVEIMAASALQLPAAKK